MHYHHYYYYYYYYSPADCLLCLFLTMANARLVRVGMVEGWQFTPKATSSRRRRTVDEYRDAMISDNHFVY